MALPFLIAKEFEDHNTRLDKAGKSASRGGFYLLLSVDPGGGVVLFESRLLRALNVRHNNY